MANDRVAALSAEVLVLPDTQKASIGSVSAEVLVSMSPPGRVVAESVEVLVLPSTQKASIGSMSVEVLIGPRGTRTEIQPNYG